MGKETLIAPAGEPISWADQSHLTVLRRRMMASQGVFPARSTLHANEGGEWMLRARYAPSDLPALLWRERWLMLAVFLVIAVVGIAFAFTLKQVYMPPIRACW